MSISNEAVEAAAWYMHDEEGYFELFEDAPAFRKEHFKEKAAGILEAAAPHMLVEVWQSAYNQGVDDERTSQANPGIAGCFCNSWPCQCVIEPARQNPYGSRA